jgi:hypothetical protein
VNADVLGVRHRRRHPGLDECLEALAWTTLAREPSKGGSDELCLDAFGEREEQRLLVVEVVVDETGRDTARLGDLGYGYALVPVLAEEFGGACEDSFASLCRVLGQFANSWILTERSVSISHEVRRD